MKFPSLRENSKKKGREYYRLKCLIDKAAKLGSEGDSFIKLEDISKATKRQHNNTGPKIAP